MQHERNCSSNEAAPSYIPTLHRGSGPIHDAMECRSTLASRVRQARCTKEFALRMLSIFTSRTRNPSRTRTCRISSAAGSRPHEAHCSTLGGFHGRPKLTTALSKASAASGGSDDARNEAADNRSQPAAPRKRQTALLRRPPESRDTMVQADPFNSQMRGSRRRRGHLARFPIQSTVDSTHSSVVP